ncbi:MAG: hypothetical protein U0559_10365 [Anaerolineae bacterium]
MRDTDHQQAAQRRADAADNQQASMARIAQQADDRIEQQRKQAGQGEQQTDLRIGQGEFITKVRQCGAIEAVNQLVEEFDAVQHSDE